MKRNRQEWTDSVGAALRDAEATPPAGGWDRLAGALAEVDRRALAAASAAADAAAVRGAGAGLRWRIYRRRIASVAAALAVVATGGYLWQAADRLPASGPAAFDPVADALLPEAAAGGAESTAAHAVVAHGTHAAVDRGPARRVPLPAETPVRAKVSAEPLPATPSRGGAAEEERTAEAERGEAPAAERAAAEPDGDAASRETASVSSASGRRTTGRSIVRRTGPEPAAVRRTSLAVHAGGVPGTSGRGDDGGLYADPAPEATSVSSFAHAPGDVVSHVVKVMTQRPPRPVEYRHLQPVSVGLAVRWGFSHGLSLATGANYTLLRSDARLEGSGGWVDQRLHFVGIPVRLDWQYLQRGRFSLYIGAGGQVEKCVAARLDGRRIDEPGVQWSLSAAAGVQCGLGGVVALYAEPEAAWYLNDTWLETSRTDHPLSFTVRLGVRFSF